MRPLWMILGPFLLVVLFAAYAALGIGTDAACDGFRFDPRAWREASTSSRLGERSQKWRIAERVADCGTLDGASRAGVLRRLGTPGQEEARALRWQVGDRGVLVVRFAGGRVSDVTGPR